VTTGIGVFKAADRQAKPGHLPAQWPVTPSTCSNCRTKASRAPVCPALAFVPVGARTRMRRVRLALHCAYRGQWGQRLVKIQFLGATQTVTGSKYLVSAKRVTRAGRLPACTRASRTCAKRNWQSCRSAVSDIDAVVLTHAHIDHSGYLPALYRQGYRGPVYCSPATHALCKVLLPDAGYLAGRGCGLPPTARNSASTRPAAPLFTEQDAYSVLKQFRVIGVRRGASRWEGTGGHADAGGPHPRRIQRAARRRRATRRLQRRPRASARSRHVSARSAAPQPTTWSSSRPTATADTPSWTSSASSRTSSRHHQRGGIVLIPGLCSGRTQTLLVYPAPVACTQAIPDCRST